VHGQYRGAIRHPERVVPLRQAYEHPRRVDAALRPEPDQASGAAPVLRRRRDDHHRVVERRHDPLDAKISEYAEAGFDHIYIHQVGPDQDGFFRFYQNEVLPKVQ
jgi:hypothetical protein